MTRSNSVGRVAAPWRWVRENLDFFKMRWRGRGRKAAEFERLLYDIDRYAEIYHRWVGRDLRAARIMEIGYGARPNRLIALQSLGYDAAGIDLDQPILDGSLGEFRRVWLQNGIRRFLKTLVRHLLFDRAERRALAAALERRSAALRIEKERFIVADAAEVDLPAGSVDFVYSEDVFEHIDLEGLDRTCRRIAGWLTPGGLAAISPLIFTGIQGGHLTDWYDAGNEAARRRSEPWEHLRQRRVVADCQLNEMRLADYRCLFERYFDILDEVRPDFGVGRGYLSNEVKADLAAFTEEELLTNHCLFVLRPKGHGSAADRTRIAAAASLL